jgi:hypothetical protein
MILALSRRRFFAHTLGATLGSFAVVGCNRAKKKYPVQGKVVYKDGGQPVPAGLVIWVESTAPPYQRSWAVIENDGKFVLSTDMEGAGAIKGEHRVRFTPGLNAIGNPEELLAKAMPRRYFEYSTSGLKVDIKPQQNDLTVEVDPPEKQAGDEKIKD